MQKFSKQQKLSYSFRSVANTSRSLARMAAHGSSHLKILQSLALSKTKTSMQKPSFLQVARPHGERADLHTKIQSRLQDKDIYLEAVFRLAKCCEQFHTGRSLPRRRRSACGYSHSSHSQPHKYKPSIVQKLSFQLSERRKHLQVARTHGGARIFTLNTTIIPRQRHLLFRSCISSCEVL